MLKITWTNAVKPRKDRKLCCSVSTAKNLSSLNASTNSFNCVSVWTQTYESFISKSTVPNSISGGGVFKNAVISASNGCEFEAFSARKQLNSVSYSQPSYTTKWRIQKQIKTTNF